MLQRIINSKHHETIFYWLECIFIVGCSYWWTNPQMAIGATLSGIDIILQLVYRDKKSEKKFEKIMDIIILLTDIVIAIWCFYHWNVPLMREPLF